MFSPSPNSKPKPRSLLALLKSNPAMSKEAFSKHWVTEHAQVVLPYFLDACVESYVQIHGPLSMSSSAPPDSNPNNPIAVLQKEIEAGEWDGCFEFIGPPDTSKATPEPAWKAAYYHDIIVSDELKLLVSEASEHVKIIEKTGIVTGERKAMIENRKSKIETDKDVMSVWEEYKRKGERGEF
ncbi:hypothetical protein BELL_0062g00210 [Botrytis elliptica]|uniref:EthD domain-containing protein n=1 Tax=Botrytis elliptica TaxID=278938 RepID=A0A4Z1JYG8_9HELO|nr:hypothetical protein EAE99_007803 [Botrytis elliptica]TGO78568.1 hypothetical protein BELL_0062g00210 [Botrytis elliptica]